MKRYALITLIGAALLSAGTAGAAPDVFTQNEFMTAESIDPGMTQTGINFTLGEDYKSYYPAFRYGLGALFEIGLKFGVSSVDTGPSDKLGALIGADLKYQLIKEAEGIPLDMAVALGLDNIIISSSNVTEVTFSTILSKGYPLTERGYKFTPYGGVEMAAMYGSFIPKDDTHVYIFGGFEWKLTQKFLMLMELKAGESVLGGIGIRFEY